jgi:hypothetical protein
MQGLVEIRSRLCEDNLPGRSGEMVRKKWSMFIISVLFLLSLTGCAGNTAGIPAEGAAAKNEMKAKTASEKADVILEGLRKKIQSGEAKIPDVIGYIDTSIPISSTKTASALIIELERLQKRELRKQEDKFYLGDVVQRKMQETFPHGSDINSVDHVQDKELQALLLETKSYGYKIETAEGVFFPVIDYGAYQQYKLYVTNDMAAYIDIMTTEADKAPVKDAGLTIEWDEVITRAVTLENFIDQYDDSAKINDVRRMYQRYVSYALYGTNNTPLFNYDTKMMAPKAKESYAKAGDAYPDSKFVQALTEMMTVLEKNNGELTEEMEQYRKTATENLTSFKSKVLPSK